MYRSPPVEPSRTIVHRPGPRIVIYVAMALLAVIALPAYVLEPARAFGGGGIVGVAALVGFEVLLLAIARRSVLLTVDARLSTLTLEDTRWPFRGRFRQVPIADLRDVTLQRAPRHPSVRIALVMKSGTEMPLTDSYFGGGAHMDRDIAAIRELCALTGGPHEAAS